MLNLQYHFCKSIKNYQSEIPAIIKGEIGLTIQLRELIF